jgi:hypothetical protein
MPKVEICTKAGRTTVRVQKQHAEVKEGKASANNKST